MFGIDNLVRTKNAKIWTFKGGIQTAATTATGWVPWVRPRNFSMFFLMAIGAGGGGGGGFTAAAAAAKGGGGGGGSGAVARMFTSAAFLPPVLHILAGNGGRGGTGSGSIGVVGGRSVICNLPGTVGTAAITVLTSGAADAGGGVAGTAAGSQAGGAAGTIATNALAVYSSFADWTAIAGQAGSAAGALGGNGVSVAWGGSGVLVSVEAAAALQAQQMLKELEEPSRLSDPTPIPLQAVLLVVALVSQGLIGIIRSSSQVEQVLEPTQQVLRHQVVGAELVQVVVVAEQEQQEARAAMAVQVSSSSLGGES